jgi:flagellar biosynthesis GTPase FlhF
MMNNINDKEQLKRRNAQYMNDSNKRFKSNIDVSGGTAERLARQAEYQRKYRARKKEDRLRQVRENTSTTTTSEINDVATAKLQERRARKAENKYTFQTLTRQFIDIIYIIKSTCFFFVRINDLLSDFI